MTDDTSDRARILQMATHMGSPDTPPEKTARNRGWLDEDGLPTDEGREMLKAMGDQQGTRTVFR
ncbi:hypothetical protein [Palleronia abyssalis]|uniref:Uncharacterized protein n=1 Tax=Palleronia abyssalis TaxID=1501240 RepID=A0A2R8BY56_9RHOB|nr:hypothetical protein [Palleronia abyssalis]SPJ25108.1 hypothetical protein PAA8504_02954 [Palleronia abyssalis]